MIEIKQDGPEQSVYKGKIVEVIHQPMLIGEKKMMYETARRSPGVRIIIEKDEKILITKEYRDELETYDYRLPGGKVFDGLDEYLARRNENLVPYAKEAAFRECREEVGFEAKQVEYILTASCGSTMDWDLYYFHAKDVELIESGQELELGEDIEVGWYTKDEVKQLCFDGNMQEYRSVGVLLIFLEQ